MDVELINRSREQLASVGGVPVNASYHWLENGTEFAGVVDGVRTPLARPVRPGERLTERVNVLAPDCAGHHRLRVTLVQEAVFWFDTLPVPVQADVDIFVNEPSDRWQLATVAALAGHAAVRDREVANLGLEIINVAGEKVSPFEVEAVFRDHPAVADVVAFAGPDPLRGEQVCVAVVLRDGARSPQKSEWRTLTEDRLASFKRPRRIVEVDAFPLGPTGKVQRARLAEQLSAQMSD